MAMIATRKVVGTRLRFWVTKNAIRQWADGMNVFFVLAIGRSGTNLLADLLDRAPAAHVVHEPVLEDFPAYKAAFHDPDLAAHYVQTFRMKEIYLRVRNMQVTSYGEVNSLLRRHVYALRSAFPRATFVHLVRDGRDVVRSMMARKTMTVQDHRTAGIHPRSDSPWAAAWEGMDRFARLCWYWQVENWWLRTAIGLTVQFESLLTSYESFSEHILNPCGVDLPEAMWSEAVNRPTNVTARHVVPHWSEWDSARLRVFEEICGTEMRANGYG
jgi:hypothetical protein